MVTPFSHHLPQTSAILKSATQDSFIVLDELGRGTATVDGYSIAHAVMNDIAHRYDQSATSFSLRPPSLHTLSLFMKHPHPTLQHTTQKGHILRKNYPHKTSTTQHNTTHAILLSSVTHPTSNTTHNTGSPAERCSRPTTTSSAAMCWPCRTTWYGHNPPPRTLLYIHPTLLYR